MPTFQFFKTTLKSKPKSAGVVMFTLSQCYCRHAPCWSILTQVTLSIDQYVVSQHRSVVLTTGSCPGQQWQSDEDNKTELTLHSSHCHCRTFLSYGNSYRSNTSVQIVNPDPGWFLADSSRGMLTQDYSWSCNNCRCWNESGQTQNWKVGVESFGWDCPGLSLTVGQPETR